MTIHIRETVEEDFERVSALLRNERLKNLRFTRNNFTKMLKRNKGYCYVAEDGRRIIGSVFATHDGAFVGYIQKVTVAEEYKRQGIASKLVTTIMQKLEEAKIPLIFAHVEKRNKPSIKLLKSLGFEIRNSHYLIDRGYKPR